MNRRRRRAIRRNARLCKVLSIVRCVVHAPRAPSSLLQDMGLVHTAWPYIERVTCHEQIQERSER